MLGYFLGKGEAEEMEDPRAAELTGALVQWFEETIGKEYQGCNCREILEENPANKMQRCPQIVEAVWEKCMELLQESSIMD